MEAVSKHAPTGAPFLRGIVERHTRFLALRLGCVCAYVWLRAYVLARGTAGEHVPVYLSAQALT